MTNIRFAWLVAAVAILALATAGAQPALATPTQTVVIDSNASHPLESAWDVAVDSAGNLYVTGTDSDNVLRRTPAGVVTEILDSTGDGVHALDWPSELEVGGDDSLYVIGAMSRNVFRRTAAGTWSQILDATGDGAGHALEAPEGLAVDASGNVFVSDPVNNWVFRITPGGAVSVVLDSTGDGMGNTLESPGRLAIDPTGNLFVVGGASKNVFRVSPGGVVTEILESTVAVPLDYPGDVLVSADGTLYLSVYLSTSRNVIVKRDPGGTVTSIPTDVYAEDLAFGPSGTVLIASRNEARVVGIRPDGPNCVVISNWETPEFIASFRVTATPDGAIYTTNVTQVLRIDGACGPPPDVAGAWHVTIDNVGSVPEHFYSLQQWTQSGFELTVTDSLSGDTFSGTVDDRGYFQLSGAAQNCSGPFCCTALSYGGQLEAGAIKWTGSLGTSAPIFNRCGGPIYPAVGTRCGNGVVDDGETCEDGNAVGGDGCAAECRVEACYECSAEVPAVCSPAIRTCASNATPGGTSLKVDASVDKPAKLQWRIGRGESSTLESLGDPTTNTSYSLCIFDRSQPEPVLVYAAGAEPGAGWRSTSSGFSLKRDDEVALDGIDRVQLKSGSTSKVKIRGGGPNFTPPDLPLSFPLTVQFQASDGGCFESAYSPSGATTNTFERVRATADAP